MRRAWLAIASSVATLACAQRMPEGERRIERLGAGSAEQASAHAAPAADPKLTAKIDKQTWRLTDAIERDPNQFAELLSLARDQSAPHLVAAGLAGLARQTLDAQNELELQQLVGMHLGASHPRVLGRALELARKLLPKASNARLLAEALIEAAQSPRFEKAPERQALLETLRDVPARFRTPRWHAVFLDALQAHEPYLVVSAAQGLLEALPTVPDRTELEAEGYLMLEAESELVRALGLDILGLTGRNARSNAMPEVYARLDDPSALVRSKACLALARSKQREAIARIAPLLDDTSLNAVDYEIPTLEGEISKKTLKGSAFSTVQDAAVGALRMLSHDTIPLQPVDPRNAPALLSDNARAAREWVQSRATAERAAADEPR